MRFEMQVGRALAVTALALSVSTAMHADSLKIKTEQGVVQGKTLNEGKVRAFLGLPYAAPPVGDLRWKAPGLPARWEGDRDGTKYGSRCYGEDFEDMAFQDSGPSENCLFLNVYTPADANDKSKLPVMFWIHGGGYAGGASSEYRHNGDFLPTKGVVLVTINYRLGVFGFLATADLAREANGAAGNYGLLDMVAALEWVRGNIRQFGGDPGNVTIFGESAGSFAVSTLMASPLAHGLFHKAIGESGGALGDGLGPDSLEPREKTDGEWVASLGVKSLAELRSWPPEKLRDAAKKAPMRFSPVMDGRLLAEPIAATYAAGRQAHVPLLAGWNLDEGGPDGMTAERWKADAAKAYGARSAEFLKLYPADTEERAARSAADYHGDLFIAFGSWKWLEAHRKTGDSPVYRYHFELQALPSKFHPGTLAFHSDDIEYVFGVLDTRPGETIRPEDRKMSDQMMDYWTNFAKTGDPNGPGLPIWPRYGAGNELIHLNAPITSGPDTVRARYEFLLKEVPALKF